jgi:hypothetical protein
LVEVLDICFFSLPEETGEVVCFEGDVIIPDILTDAVVTDQF